MVKAKDTKKQTGRFGKIYRQFTRVKFNKYKQQFPKIRESELIAKILKQWEAMDQEAKIDLEKRFVQRSGKDFLEDPSSSDKKSKEKKQAEEKNKSSSDPQKTKKIGKGKKKPSPKARVFVEKQLSSYPKSSSQRKTPVFPKTSSSPTERQVKSRKSSQNSKSPGKKSTPEKKETSSSQIGLTKAKKGDVKAQKEKRNAEYLNFFKYYHERLTSEHPRWSTAQISTIIKLLWRKRNKGGRRRSIKQKGLTGRQLYNRTKINEGFLKEQIKQLWRALPHESKKYWQIRGQGKPNRSKKDSGRFVRKVLNGGVSQSVQAEETQSNSYNWMNQLIK